MRNGRHRLLDLYCGAGGSAAGYANAGFEVVGVDIAPQPHYPFRFIQADALSIDPSGFDAVHASPVCKLYSQASSQWNCDRDSHPDQIPATRDYCKASGLPYVIENVEGAPLVDPVMLCGSMFGLCIERGWLKRHRLFETSFRVNQLHCGHPDGVRAIDCSGTGGNGGRSNKPTAQEARELLQCDWMTRAECSQAVPPAYTEYIGYYLRGAISG